MKIIGNTPEGDLIIQVSQAEWDGLWQDVRAKENWRAFIEVWSKTEAYEISEKFGNRRSLIEAASRRSEIDGSIQSLLDLADGKIRVRGFSPSLQARLKKLLNEQT